MQKIFSKNLFEKYESGLQRVRTQSAFTLVELIVVITIVWILSTIGFVAYSGYLGWARDGNRIASLTKLSDSLQTYAAAKSLPLPDDAINIDASGTTIAYQGYVGENVLETIDFTNGGKDPKDDSYYTYYLTKDRKKLQLLTFLEEQTVFQNGTGIKKTFASDYSNRYPKTYGQKLGVLISSESATKNTPAQEISANITSGKVDVVTTNSWYTAIINEDESITGTGGKLKILKTYSDFKNSKFILDIFNNFPESSYNFSTSGSSITFRISGNWNYYDEYVSCPEIEFFTSQQMKILEKMYEEGFSPVNINSDVVFRYMGDDSIPKHYVYGKKIQDFTDYNMHLDFSAGDNTTLTLNTDKITIRCSGVKCWENALPIIKSEPIFLYKFQLNPQCNGASALNNQFSRNRFTFQWNYYEVSFSK